MEIIKTSPEEQQAASSTKTELTLVLNRIEGNQKTLETDFVKLGTLLSSIQENKYWIQYGHRSFNQFLESIKGKVKKGRTQLYACTRIAQQLLPVVPDNELVDMGISKASALCSAVRKTGKNPTEDLISKSKDESVEEFKGSINDAFGLRKEEDKGKWRDLSGFYAENDEWEEFLRCVQVMSRIDPPLQINSWSDAKPHERKEIIQRMVATCLVEYETQLV